MPQVPAAPTVAAAAVNAAKRGPPLTVHQFAPHDFTCRLAAPISIDAANASAGGSETQELLDSLAKELRQLLPPRVAWRTSAMMLINGGTTLRIVDQRCAAFVCGLLLRHRVLRFAVGEVTMAPTAAAATAPSVESQQQLASHMNFDDDLWAACLPAANAFRQDMGVSPDDSDLWLARFIEHCARQVHVLGAYRPNGQPNALIVAAVVLHQRGAALSDLTTLTRHQSRYVRAVALILGRYILAPEDCAPLFGLVPLTATQTTQATATTIGAAAARPGAAGASKDAAIVDRTVVQLDDESGVAEFGEWARKLLLEDEVCEFWLPVYAPHIVNAFSERISAALAGGGGPRGPAVPKAAAAQQRSSSAAAVGEQQPVVASAATAAEKKGADQQRPASMFKGFKSAAEMAKHFQAAAMGAAVGSNQAAAPAALKQHRAEQGGVGAVATIAAGPQPADVIAKSRDEILAELKQKRIDRLRGSYAALSSTIAATADLQRSGRRGAEAALGRRAEGRRADAPSAEVNNIAVDPLASAEELVASMWPSERVGRFNHATAAAKAPTRIDDLFSSVAKQRLLHSAVVAPGEVELVF